MSQYETELVVLLVRDIYGSVSAVCAPLLRSANIQTVVDELLKYGRLSLPLIARYSKLSSATIQRALIPLIQNRFVLYWVDESEHTTYTASASNMYNILRSGMFVTYVANKYADVDGAPEVVRNMLLYGHIRASDYLSAQPPEKAEAARNAVTLLLQHKLLSTLSKHEFHPSSDLYMRIYKRRLAAIPRIKTVSQSKRETQAHSEAQEEYLALQRIHDDIHDGLKDNQVNDTAVLTLNYEKYILLLRSQIFVHHAARRIGDITAEVYRQVLACMEPKLYRCKEAADRVSSLEILRNLDPNLDLNVFVDPSRKRARSSGGRASKRVRRDSPEIEDHNLSESDDDDDDDDEVGSRLEHLNLHLSLLAGNSVPFLNRAGNKGGGEWNVDFDRLTKKIQQIEYDRLITQKQGAVACRLLRIIRDKGRIDEKQLAEIALLPPKDIRAHLTALHEIGCLDLQEVPRGTDRAPSRTYYLWFHKPLSAYALMVQAVVKTITRCYSRIVEERDRRPTVMNKLLREDISQNEAMLSPAEREEVSRVRAIERRYISQIVRLDRLTLIFRDM